MMNPRLLPFNLNPLSILQNNHQSSAQQITTSTNPQEQQHTIKRSSSFFQTNTISNLPATFDEHQWVKQIRQTLDEDLEEENETVVSIFVVPKTLLMTDPESYIPQQVAIGPYHHLKPEVYDMERYKVAVAKRYQKVLPGDLKIEHHVDELMKHEMQIRASYHRPLTIEGETLAWMMAVDSCFLFEFLQFCGASRKSKALTKVSSRFRHLLDIAGNKTVHNGILRDIMMLENQVPIFVLRMQLEFQLSSTESAEEMLEEMLTLLSQQLSPFKTMNPAQKIDVKCCAHILDFMYRYIIPKIEAPVEIVVVSDEDDEAKEEEDVEADVVVEKPFSRRRLVREALNKTWQAFSMSERGPVQWVKRIIFSKPVKALIKFPLTMLTKIPMLGMMKGPVEKMFHTVGQEKKVAKKKDKEEGDENGPPVLEDITMPTITQLLSVGVHFIPTNGGIMTIRFEESTRMFYIPTITIDVNSEAILRNLVAYEACATSGSLLLSRYTELMNGIIDTDEDVRFLCRKGIIVNHLKSDHEVANMWNGMNKSVRLTKVPGLDDVIRQVNKYYDGRWTVKGEKFMRIYVFGSWKILTFLGAVMFLLLMVLQSFCQVYSCSRVFHINGLLPAGVNGLLPGNSTTTTIPA